MRARNGYYLPNPQMQLRAGDSWVPVYEALALDWIDRGCGREGQYGVRPAIIVEHLSAPVVF